MKSMFKLRFIFGILFVTTLLTGCGGGTSSKTIDDLITHFKDKGFEGETKDMLFGLIGATDGVAYSGENFSLEVYKFDDPGKIPDMLNYRNGNFGMMVTSPNEDERGPLLEAFKSFK